MKWRKRETLVHTRAMLLARIIMMMNVSKYLCSTSLYMTKRQLPQILPGNVWENESIHGHMLAQYWGQQSSGYCNRYIIVSQLSYVSHSYHCTSFCFSCIYHSWRIKIFKATQRFCVVVRNSLLYYYHYYYYSASTVIDYALRQQKGSLVA